MKEPNYTCPTIDSIIENMSEAQQQAIQIKKLVYAASYDIADPSNVDENLSKIKDCAEDIGDCCNIIDMMEELRTANEQLRECVQHWKDEFEDLQNQLDEVT